MFHPVFLWLNKSDQNLQDVCMWLDLVPINTHTYFEYPPNTHTKNALLLGLVCTNILSKSIFKVHTQWRIQG